MAKLWAGRSSGEVSAIANDFNSSISFDSRMYRQDIRGSIAHATMLAAQGLISGDDLEQIKSGLESVLADIDSGALPFDPEAEDIHMFVEAELTKRIGSAGKRLHTARSRNDQVALDLRLYLRDECKEVCELLKNALKVLSDKAYENFDSIMPGYTHLQRAQPITMGQHLCAWCMMLMRDLGRIEDALERMNVSPLGSCALAGTTHNINRQMTSELLGFNGPSLNSLDGVADRDYCIELVSAFSVCMMHLSRFCEELILWTSLEFKFVELSDAYTTGSSIMPQKKNSDMAELIRGKTGRVYGDLITLLTMLKGLPLAYNKDMQEDKEAVFDALDTLKLCLSIFNPMVETMTVKRDNMRRAAAEGFINATDLADWLVGKGMPFREAYNITGKLVAYCIERKTTLEALSMDEYKQFSELFDDGLYGAIDMSTCVNNRISFGGTAPENVLYQIGQIRKFTEEK